MKFVKDPVLFRVLNADRRARDFFLPGLCSGRRKDSVGPLGDFTADLTPTDRCKIAKPAGRGAWAGTKPAGLGPYHDACRTAVEALTKTGLIPSHKTEDDPCQTTQTRTFTAVTTSAGVASLLHLASCLRSSCCWLLSVRWGQAVAKVRQRRMPSRQPLKARLHRLLKARLCPPNNSNLHSRTALGGCFAAPAFLPVSYTHLTLPTICSV